MSKSDEESCLGCQDEQHEIDIEVETPNSDTMNNIDEEIDVSTDTFDKLKSSTLPTCLLVQRGSFFLASLPLKKINPHAFKVDYIEEFIIVLHKFINAQITDVGLAQADINNAMERKYEEIRETLTKKQSVPFNSDDAYNSDKYFKYFLRVVKKYYSRQNKALYNFFKLHFDFINKIHRKRTKYLEYWKTLYEKWIEESDQEKQKIRQKWCARNHLPKDDDYTNLKEKTIDYDTLKEETKDVDALQQEYHENIKRIESIFEFKQKFKRIITEFLRAIEIEFENGSFVPPKQKIEVYNVSVSGKPDALLFNFKTLYDNHVGVQQVILENLSKFVDDVKKNKVISIHKAHEKKQMMYLKRLYSIYDIRYCVMDYFLDKQYIILYLLKLIHFLIFLVSIYLTEKIFSEMYMKKVYAENTDPPRLLIMLVIILALNTGFMLFLITVLYLSTILLQNFNSHSLIDSNLVMLLIKDAGLYMLLLAIFGSFLGYVIEKKKYFKYKTEGLRTIRAFKEILIGIGGILMIVPFFSFFV